MVDFLHKAQVTIMLEEKVVLEGVLSLVCPGHGKQRAVGLRIYRIAALCDIQSHGARDTDPEWEGIGVSLSPKLIRANTRH